MDARSRLVNRCTEFLNFLLPRSPDFESYKVKYKDRQYTFEMYCEDGTFYAYYMPEHMMDEHEYERFKTYIGQVIK